MTPYISLFFLLVFFATNPIYFTHRFRIIGLIAIMTCFVIFTGLRDGIGTDWENYLALLKTFESKKNLIKILIDPSYSLLNIVSIKLGLGIHFINLVCSSIFMMGIYALCIRQPNPWLALSIAAPYLIFVVSMNYTRQSAAIGLFILAILSINSNKRLKYIIYTILAISFHKTALLLLLFFPRIFKKKLTITYVSSVATITFLFTFFWPYITGLFSVYVENRMESSGALVRILITGLAGLSFFYFKDLWKKMYKNDYYCWKWFSFLSIICVPMVFLASTAVDRIGLYLLPLQVASFSKLPFFFTGITRTTIFSIIIFFYAALLIYWLNYSIYAKCCWLPYKIHLGL